MNGSIVRRPLLLLSGLILAALSCGLPGGACPVAPTAGPAATPAIFLPPEWTPTPAPPTPEIPPGWEEFHAGRAHLWLPESFEGGDMGVKFQAILDTLKSLGPDFARTAEILEQNPDVFVLWTVDTLRGPSGSITQANVTREDVPEGTTVQEYLDASIELMPSGLTLVDQGTLALGSYESGKLVMSSNIEGLRRISVVYTIKDGDRF